MTSQTDVHAQESQALDGMSASSPFSQRPDSSHHPPSPADVLNRGLVKRRPNSEDRRSVIPESTPSASEALLRYRDGMRSFVRHLGALLDQNEQEQFIHLARKIEESLQRGPKNGAFDREA